MTDRSGLLASGALAALWLAAAQPALAAPAGSGLSIEAGTSQRVLTAGKSERIYLKITVKAPRLVATERRTPVNVALVVDRSGSMAGQRIAAAKAAARMAVDRLAAEDIVSVVAYDHNVDVLHPASRLHSHSEIKAKIDTLRAGGRTALYAGVVEGSGQVGRNAAPHRVNRVILLSDGLANVGPSTPKELADLGRELARKGITVSTIGLGLDYNEDLMQRLAAASDGNHAFVEKPEKLVEIFNAEFGDVLSVAARDLVITIECKAGFTPRRVLGREAKIEGQRISLRLAQLYSGQERHLTLELDTSPAAAASGEAVVAELGVDYAGQAGESRQQARTSAAARWSTSEEEAKASLDKAVMAEVTTQIATEQNEKAVELRDKGDIAGARRLLESNALFLKERAESYATGSRPAPTASTGALSDLAARNKAAAESLDAGSWEKTRKLMRQDQHRSKVQQRY
jgi:Ca-activated chloride channel family protein